MSFQTFMATYFHCKEKSSLDILVDNYFYGREDVWKNIITMMTELSFLEEFFPMTAL